MDAAALGRCLIDYNPMETEEYEEVVAAWLASLLVLADHLAQHPAATSAAADAEQGQLPLPPTPPSKQELAACAPFATHFSPFHAPHQRQSVKIFRWSAIHISMLT